MNPHLLHQCLIGSAEESPLAPAVVLDEEEITYEELAEKSANLASWLSSEGIVQGDMVGIYLNKSIESIISIYGILMCGAAYVPIDPASPPTRVRQIVENCRIRTLITSTRVWKERVAEILDAGPIEVLIMVGEVDKGMADVAGPEISTWKKASSTQRIQRELWFGSDSNTAYILHTSGSTGQPKGVVITHQNALTFVKTAAEYFGVSSGDRFACHAPLHFDLTVFDIFVAALTGGTLVLLPANLSLFPIRLSEYILSQGVTVWNSVSSVLSLLADKGCPQGTRFNDMRLVIFSGEVLPAKYLRKLSEHMDQATFCNIYGQTEANSSTCYIVKDIPDDDSWRIPIGKPMPNFEVFLHSDELGEIREPDKEGEILVSSSTIALGYLNDKVLTKEKFVDDPRFSFPASRVYRTGDLGRYNGDGDLIFVGRQDNMVKVRGHRVELDEIERCLCAHDYVQLAVVVAVPDEKFTNRIFSFVSLKENNPDIPDTLLAFCALSLPQYMVPEKITHIKEFPLTPNDKIDRKALTEKASSWMIT